MYQQDNYLNAGFTQRFINEATLYKGLVLGRVIAQYKDLLRISTGYNELLAEISGKLRYQASSLADFPAVGDFIMVDRSSNENGNALIHHVLTRKSVFLRKAAGTSHDVQVVAANIDTVFICMALNNDYNLRRMERYLSIAWDSGAVPVVVLTKADLCQAVIEKVAEVEGVSPGVEILVTSSLTKDGEKPIHAYLSPGKTVAFIGSSGVGKSTLINRLLGEDLIETNETRKDDKGRHTTTHRELLMIPSGGAVIDTPGMREMGLENADLSKAFADIGELAEQCKFGDCTHQREPGCAVRHAIETGELEEDRLQSYLKLEKEATYEGLNAKQIEKKKMDNMFSDFGSMKNVRDFIKNKNRRK